MFISKIQTGIRSSYQAGDLSATVRLKACRLLGGSGGRQSKLERRVLEVRKFVFLARKRLYAIGLRAIFFSITAAAFSAFFLRLNTFRM